MPLPLNEILKLAKAQEHSDEFLADIEFYSDELSKKNLPIIFSTHHLALIIGIPVVHLLAIIKKPENHYSTYKLRKKTGGHRWIMSPDPTLKYVQTWIKVNILEKVELHSAVNGFRMGHSIKSNALPHINKELILNVDLYKFYDSISEPRVFGIFKWLGFHSNLAVDFAKLLCVSAPQSYWNEITAEGRFSKAFLEAKHPILPQGSPASPLVSNIIANSLDRRLFALSKNRNLDYTRYADDLTFSGTKREMISLSIVKEVIQQEGFIINETKIKHVSQHTRQMVTGLVVNSCVRVPIAYKRKIFTELYFCLTKGVKSHLDWMETQKDQARRSNYKDHLLGKIFFVYSIERKVGEKMLSQFNQINWEI